MSVCTFFGHRDCPEAIRTKLREVLVDLIAHHGVDQFYVGNNGAFDRLVRGVLRELAGEYPQIRCAVVLERLPTEKSDAFSNEDTLFPEGIEAALPRFAIVWRNKWMLQRASFVVTYVTHPWGGAAQFAKVAERQKKTVINLAEPSLRNTDLRL